MFRRGSSRREGPGLLRTVGRTAAIAGTATVVSHGVSGAMTNRAHQQAAAPPPAATPVQQQMESVQAQEIAQQTGSAPGTDLIAQLQQLADLKSAGMLSDDEFERAKAKVLGGSSSS
jgi:hypothetical protein